MPRGVPKAKKGPTDGINKAQLIRDAFKKLGINTPAKEIMAECAANGAEVAAAQISNLRTKIKEGRGKKKRGRKAKAEAGAADAPVTQMELISARVMADKVGGVPRAKVLLDLLNKLR